MIRENYSIKCAASVSYQFTHTQTFSVYTRSICFFGALLSGSVHGGSGGTHFILYLSSMSKKNPNKTKRIIHNIQLFLPQYSFISVLSSPCTTLRTRLKQMVQWQNEHDYACTRIKQKR